MGWKKRNSEKLNIVLNKDFEEIKNIEKYLYIEYIFYKIKLRGNFIINKKINSDEEIIESITLELNKINEKNINIESIQSFIDKIPNFKKNNKNNDILEIQKRFCQSGEALDNKCVSYNDIDKPLDNNNYNKCSYGTFCKYKVIGLDNEKNINFPCPCGYNSEGQGYCPHFHEYWKDERNEYQDILKNNYDNECHTENRYNCYEKDKEEKEKELKNKIINGHLFYNSVPCAKKVLDGEYLGIRKMIIAFGILFTLI